MAVLTTITNVKPIREDLSDTIYDISPEDVPFLSQLKHQSVSNTLYEWQTDILIAAAAAGQAAEGAAAGFDAINDTTRLTNVTEIIEKAAETSGTLAAVDNAGMAKQMAYQIIRKGKEIKRDTEKHLMGVHQIKVTGATRKTAAYASWTGASSSVGGGTGAVADAEGTDVPTNGDDRALTEALLGTVIDAMYEDGAVPNIIMARPKQKRVITGFAGNSSQGGTAGNVTHNNSDKRVINAVSVYVSDYGDLKVLPNRFGLEDEVLVYESDQVCLAVLRPMKSTELAKVGDSERRQVVQECGLLVKNPLGVAGIFDLS